MSALAHALPTRRPDTGSQRPHIEIVSTRQQRKARPKSAYAIVTVLALFAIFAAQLLLSIVLSDGAYRLANLQSAERDLVRVEQSLSEQLSVRDSTQLLAANAATLGMVPASSPYFLDLETGAVAAAPGTADPMGCGGTCGFVSNSLLTGVSLVDPSAPSPTVDPAPVATSATADAAGGPSTAGTLPAPRTR